MIDHVNATINPRRKTNRKQAFQIHNTRRTKRIFNLIKIELSVIKVYVPLSAYVVISNLTNPIPKLDPVSMIELVAKKKATAFLPAGRLM